MDMQTEDMATFLLSLTEEQTSSCEANEKTLAALMSGGLSEATAVLFHRAMLSVRTIAPKTTLEGAFELALWVGLSFIGSPEVMRRLNEGREDDRVFFGVEPRSPFTDATPANTPRGGVRVARVRAGRVRGVALREL